MRGRRRVSWRICFRCRSAFCLCVCVFVHGKGGLYIGNCFGACEFGWCDEVSEFFLFLYNISVKIDIKEMKKEEKYENCGFD